MATYFHGSSEIQPANDGLQTLYLVNPTYLPYSSVPSFNAAGNSLTLTNIPHAPPSSHPHLTSIHLPTSPPVMGPTNSDDPLRSSGLHAVSLYNLCVGVDQNSGQITVPTGGGHDEFYRRFYPPVVSPTWQGLSLSLSSEQVSTYRSSSSNVDMQGQSSSSTTASFPAVSNGFSGVHGVALGSKFLRAAQELLDEVVNVGKIIKFDQPITNGMIKEKMKESTAGEVAGSGSEAIGNGHHYKPASELTTAERQELKMKKTKLLNMLEQIEERYKQYQQQMQTVVSCFEQIAGLDSAKSYTGLGLQTISKRFRCLKDAISVQVKATSKSLEDEEDWLSGATTTSFKVEAGYSKLRYIDHQLRQQRALQQIGVVRNNAWRSQRGLPERAVSVLRAWLFEHFLHPYPKDSDKIVLAKQTGLTRSQVSNWFINARVRLWKPMVEEMYMEEIKEKKPKNLDDEDQKNSTNKHHEHKKYEYSLPSPQNQIYNDIVEESKQEIKNQFSSNSTMSRSLHQHQTSFINLVGSSDYRVEPARINSTKAADNDDNQIRSSTTKKQRILSHELQNSPSRKIVLSSGIEMKQIITSGNGGMNLSKFGDGDDDDDDNDDDDDDDQNLINGSGGFGGYINLMDQQLSTPRLIHGKSNGISLTLGPPPHCESISLSGNLNSFPSNQLHIRRLELGNGDDQPDFCWN